MTPGPVADLAEGDGGHGRCGHGQVVSHVESFEGRFRPARVRHPSGGVPPGCGGAPLRVDQAYAGAFAWFVWRPAISTRRALRSVLMLTASVHRLQTAPMVAVVPQPCAL